MQKIRIIQLIPHMGNGGAQQVVTNYMKRFSYDDKIDCKLLVVEEKTNSKYDKYLEQEKMDVKYLNIPKRISKISFNNRIKRMIVLNKKICLELEKYQPNVVHVHTINTLLFCVRFLKRNGNIPLLVTIHSDPMRTKGTMLRYLRRILKKYNVTLVCLNENHSEVTKKHFHVTNTLIVRNGINISEIKREIIDKKMARKMYNISNDDYVIVGVGRLNKIKKFDFLIKSFSLVVKKNKNALLIIAGEGEEYKYLVSLVEELNLHNRVKLIGNVKNVIPLYCAADIFALTSESESTSLVLLEAQICNLNCVVSSGIPLESLVTDKVVLMNSNADEKQWADSLVSCKDFHKKVCNLSLYDLDSTLEKIRQLYIDYGEHKYEK